MQKLSSKQNTSRALALAVFCMLVLGGAPSAVHAFFYNTETSERNSFSASSLDLLLSLESSDADSRKIAVSNSSPELLLYAAHVKEISDPAVSFCASVNVSLGDGAETDLLSFTKSKTLLTSGASEELSYEFSVDDDEVVYAGKTCTVNFVYEASQEHYSHGEAFFDTETDTVTLHGADFGEPPSEEAEIVINEIWVNPSAGVGNSHGNAGAWIELYNMGDAPADAANWIITNSAGDEHVVSGPSGVTGSSTMIPADEYLKVKVNKDFFSTSGDTVTLYRADGVGARKEVDEYTYDADQIANGKTTGRCLNGMGAPTGPLKQTGGRENECDNTRGGMQRTAHTLRALTGKKYTTSQTPIPLPKKKTVNEEPMKKPEDTEEELGDVQAKKEEDDKEGTAGEGSGEKLVKVKKEQEKKVNKKPAEKEEKQEAPAPAEQTAEANTETS